MNVSDLMEYISGRDLSLEKEVESWINESEENRREYFRFKELLSVKTVRQNSSSSALDAAIGGIHSRVQADKSRRRYRRSLAFAWSVSACLAIILLCGALRQALPNSMDVLIANENEPVSLYSLPDGTKAFLRQGSELSYANAFNSKNRTVSVKGEVYLDVARNEDMPFVVKTQNAQVRVLGTAFDVRSTSELTDVVLERGEVAICNAKGAVIADLLPGNRAEVSSDGGVLLSSVSTSDFTKWRYDYKVYENCSYDDFVNMMESRFDVRFIYDPAMFSSAYFSIAISESDTLEDILSMMEYMVNAHYKVVGRNIYVTNTK